MHGVERLTKGVISRTMPSWAQQEPWYCASNRNSRRPTQTGLRPAVTSSARIILSYGKPVLGGSQIFGKVRCQNVDMKQVLHREPTNIWFSSATEKEIRPVLCCVTCTTCVSMHVGRQLLRAANTWLKNRRATASQQCHLVYHQLWE